MKKTILTLLFGTAVLLSSAFAGSVSDIEASLADSEAKFEKLVPTGFAWRWTGDHIKKAREAISSGDTAEAEKLAERAAFEVERAQEQLEKAETVWQLAVPK